MAISVAFLVVRLTGWLWSWRWELAPLLVWWLAYGTLAPLLPWTWLAGLVSLLPAAPVGWLWWNPEAFKRHQEHRRLRKFRRRFPETAERLGLVVRYQDGSIRTPVVQEVKPHLGGAVVTLALPTGLAASQVESQSDHLAVAFGAAAALIRRNPRDARLLDVEVINGDDPLFTGELTSSVDPFELFQPGRHADDPIPMGLLSNGETATITLKERNILVAGAPGSGKSVGIQLVISAAAFSSDTEIWAIDPKGGVELVSYWDEVLSRSTDCAPRKDEDGKPIPGTGLDDAADLLQDLVLEMEARYGHMKDRKLRYLPPSSDHPRILLVVDELASLTQAEDRKQKALLTGLLTDILRRGRACGISTVLALQNAKAENIPTNMRSLVTYRFGFRIGESASSDIALGDGQAKLGFDSSEIPADCPGLCYMLGEGAKQAQRLRTFYLSDDDLHRLATAAAEFRSESAVPFLSDDDFRKLEDLANNTNEDESDACAVVSGCSEHLGKTGYEQFQASEECEACRTHRYDPYKGEQ
jgi:S-DNA-T family DNA segregation ATPase FtsK/SpoIIIE